MFSIDAGRNWTQWDHGFPHVLPWILVIHPREHDLVIGTFGRAAYVLDDIRPLRRIASDGSALLDKELVLFDPPVAYHVLNQQPSGSRFGADAIYNGENRPRGAMITYFSRIPEEPTPGSNVDSGEKSKGKKRKSEVSEDEKTPEKQEQVSRDSVTLEIYNNSNELIRTLKRKAPDTTGVNRIFWYLDEKGADSPGRRAQRSGQEPGGVDVLPGTYKLKMSYGESVDSAMIEVKFDPRVEISMATLQAKYSYGKRLEKNQQIAADALKRLRESSEIAADYAKRLDRHG